MESKVKSTVNKQVDEASLKVNLKLNTQQIYFKVRHNAFLWTMTIDSITFSYKEALC
jgi:hypothetical protein